MDALILSIQTFIAKHSKSKGPLIVGFSGGSDSTALVKLLIAAGVKNLHLAHFDHGWRAESGLETRLLEKKAKEWNLPFWSEKGEAKSFKENEARQERFAYFQRLYKQLSASFLILGHQKEDLAETVLKRVFEGAHLVSLYGMKPLVELSGMHVWRPLLSVSKEDLRCFLRERQEEWLEDSTNIDPSYLRGRMRKGLMADLSCSFGKEITAPLARLSARSEELDRYLMKKAAFVQKVTGPFGTFWELPEERIEARFLLKQIFKERASLGEVEKALDLLSSKAANCRLSRSFFIDRGLLFSIESAFEDVEVETALCKSPPSYPSDWRSAWTGRAWVGLSGESYTLLPPRKGAFSKKLGNEKIPACVRILFPLVEQGKKEVAEFLSRKNKRSECTFPIYLHLKIKTRHPISCSVGVV